MVKALKIEIFLLCMIVLIGLAARSRHSLFSSTQQLLFSTLGYTSAAYMLFDIIWTLSDGVGGTLGIAANWISNAVSFSLFAAACLIWFIYSETVQGSRLLTARSRVALVTLPAALVVVLAFSSYWTHALFYIDAQGAYRRGFVYMIQPIVSYCYVIYTSLHAFIQSCKVESLQKKAIYQTLAFFAIPALVAGVFQVFYSGPCLSVGIMLSMLQLYIVCQEQMISTDPLTGLNNRNRFETYTIAGEPGSGVMCLNGAAARQVQVGDHIILMCYASMTPEEAKDYRPTVVFVNEDNSISRITSYEKHGEIG